MKIKKKKKNHLSLKFKLVDAKRYIGKVEGFKTFFKITMNKNYMYDEELFIATVLHELIHVDYFMLAKENGGILTFEESEAVGNLHDDRELNIGDYTNISVDELNWDSERKHRKMILNSKYGIRPKVKK